MLGFYERATPLATLLVVALCLASACNDDEHNGGDDVGVTDDASDSTDDTDGVPDADEPPLQEGWASGPAPCQRHNAWYFTSRDEGFAGCGEDAEGQVLWHTTDGGATWEELDWFNTVRVNDVRLGPDDVLYGAGVDSINGWSAWEFGDPPLFQHDVIHSPGSNAFTNVAQGRSIAITDSGEILLTDLTSSSVAYRAEGQSEFTEYRGLSDEYLYDGEEEPRTSVADFVYARGDQFYAIGGSLTASAAVFLPSEHPDATFELFRVDLQEESHAGELRDFHIWDDHSMIAVGRDQSQRYPLIYVADGDPYEEENWERIWLWDSDPDMDFEGSINALAVQGDSVIAVGERIPTSAGGFVIKSEDRGQSWENVFPDPQAVFGTSTVPIADNIWWFDDGDVVAPGLIYSAD